ncbi:bifunctional phosphopantothenoylcysteine decarboxylase/phosphopantothenate--cysteine ligase CoaBC [Frigoribacterium sp. 2-23]|uniref:bifunctional phosphopantothenoylcysteine decarboxylase/phosphopantothenate--cysteine ligase CoaBC n=1 Tax=Frigoribacterium sp. 2-23 TaxID=3415006 RepID=UPI003C6EC76A
MTIVVGVSGGIAAYKAVSIVRGFVLRGHDVHVVPTENALRFVGAPTFEAVSRNPVTASLYDDVAEVRHVALGQRADLVVVAPATAHTLAAMATGLASDLLGTTLLATTAPVVVAPAMHTEMWRHPSTQANVAVLRRRGVVVVGPDDGPLTGGDVGPGRLSDPDRIVDEALAAATAGDAPLDLAGLEVVVSLGGTREPLDPVRYLGNRSSGRQGQALAADAARRGARVTVVAAHADRDVRAALAAVRQSDGEPITIVDVGTALELSAAVHQAAETADVVVMAAAVADYRPAAVAETKIKKDVQGDTLTLRLVENPDVLAGLAASRRPGQTVVGFAAETADDEEALLALGRTKMARKKADLLVLNPVGWTRGFGSDESTATIISVSGDVVARASGSKTGVSAAIWDAVLAVRA